MSILLLNPFLYLFHYKKSMLLKYILRCRQKAEREARETQAKQEAREREPEQEAGQRQAKPEGGKEWPRNRQSKNKHSGR